jgi:hypothetical protein
MDEPFIFSGIKTWPLVSSPSHIGNPCHGYTYIYKTTIYIYYSTINGLLPVSQSKFDLGTYLFVNLDRGTYRITNRAESQRFLCNFGLLAYWRWWLPIASLNCQIIVRLFCGWLRIHVKINHIPPISPLEYPHPQHAGGPILLTSEENQSLLEMPGLPGLHFRQTWTVSSLSTKRFLIPEFLSIHMSWQTRKTWQNGEPNI